jgi:hypothetical protein
MSERFHRVNAHRSPGWRQSCNHRDGQKQQRPTGERNGVDRVEPIEHAAQKVRGTDSENHANQQSSSDGTDACAHHERENVPFLRTDRHADAHFACPENDNVGRVPTRIITTGAPPIGAETVIFAC